jgi:hypothetical protein
MHRLRTSILIAAMVCLLSLSVAQPSMANGPSGNVTGTIAISESCTFTLNVPLSFGLGMTDDSPSSAQGGGTFYVMSNDPNGYDIYVYAPTGWANTANNSEVINSDVVSYDDNSNGNWIPLTSEGWARWGESNGVSLAQGDSWPFGGYYLNTIPNVSAGTYNQLVYWLLLCR